MPLQLYFGPGACSFVPHVLLEATGAPFEAKMVALHKDEQHSPEYLKINPDGQVPVLVDGERIVRQIVAISTYLADTFPDAKLLPTDPGEKAAVLEPLAWFNNTVHGTFTHFFKPGKFVADDAMWPALKAAAVDTYRGHLDRIEQMVAAARARSGKAQGEVLFLAGEHLTPLDPYAFTLNRWGTMAGIDPAERPELWAWVQALAQHPPVARALARERIPISHYKPKAA